METQATPFMQGYIANRTNTGENNPYPIDTPDWREWHRGFNAYWDSIPTKR